MKNIKKLSLGLATVAIMAGSVSCTDLIDDSYGKVVSEQYSPKTEADISALVNAAYIPWRQTMLLWNGIVRSNELCADEDIIPGRDGIGWIDGYIYKRWHQHSWTTEDEGVVVGWERTFEGINTCNRVLSQIEDGIIAVEGDTKTSLVSELKVLRASYYYLLCDLYGNVPLVTDFKDTELPKQSTRSEIFNFIIKEINDNVNNLSDEARGVHYGRFNKWAAYTLLAKMYLNAEVYSGTAAWDACVQACDKVISHAKATGDYALEEDINAPFITDNEGSKEIIFGLPFDEIYVTDWNAFDFHMYTLAPENQDTYQLKARPWGGVCAIPQFISTFDEDDQRLADWYISGPQKDYAGNDLMRSDGKGQLIYIKEVSSIDGSDMAMGYRWGKFEYRTGITNRLSNDWPQLRYADVLLMKAESLMRQGKAGAGELVTEVRARAFNSNPEKAVVSDEDLTKGSCYKYGRDDVYTKTEEGGADIKYGRFLDELGWEFCQEGRRRQDMIRFGVFTTKSWFSHDKSDATKNLYPIPNKIMLTNSNLKQNPGY